MCGVRRSLCSRVREARARMTGLTTEKQAKVISDVSGAPISELRGTPKWLASCFIDSISTENSDPEYVNSWELRNDK